MTIAQLRTICVLAFAAFCCVELPILIAQVQSVGADASTTGGAAAVEEWGNSFVTSIFVTWGLRIIREHAGISWFTDQTALRVQRAIAGTAAFLSGLGLNFAFDSAAGSATIVGLPQNQPSIGMAILVLAVTSLGHMIRQFGFMEVVYQAAFKRATPEKA